MKTNLLKKCRKKIKLFERNGKFYVNTGYGVNEFIAYIDAIKYRRHRIIKHAEFIFKNEPSFLKNK